MSTVPTTRHEHFHALAAAVREGEQTPEQRERLIALFHSLSAAATLAPG
ncbi:MAG: hypothetical protein ACRDS9_24835 [Pseudonocardiaceae bacterium]